MYYFVREISLDYILDAASLWLAWKLPTLNSNFSKNLRVFSCNSAFLTASCSDRGDVAMTVVTMSRYFNFLLQYFRDTLFKKFWVTFLACILARSYIYKTFFLQKYWYELGKDDGFKIIIM